VRRAQERREQATPSSLPTTGVQAYQDVSFVRERVISLLRDEKQSVQEEERPLVLGPLDTEGSLEHQLSIAGQVWALPVGEQALYLLREGMSHEIKEEVNSKAPRTW
jgi:hypothetical protein